MANQTNVFPFICLANQTNGFPGSPGSTLSHISSTSLSYTQYKSCAYNHLIFLSLLYIEGRAWRFSLWFPWIPVHFELSGHVLDLYSLPERWLDHMATVNYNLRLDDKHPGNLYRIHTGNLDTLLSGRGCPPGTLTHIQGRGTSGPHSATGTPPHQSSCISHTVLIPTNRNDEHP